MCYSRLAALNRRSDTPLQVDIPAPSADQPPWTKVGVVAAIGFVIGVAWPRVAGFQIGPAPPQDGRPAAIALPSPRSAAPIASQGAPPAPTASGGAATTNEETVSVAAGELVKCRDAKGKALDKCDEIAVDPLLVPRLRELTRCPSAIGLAGKVTIAFDLDFKHRKIAVQRAKGKAQLPRTTLDGVTRCAEKGAAGVSLDDLTHEATRYTVSYVLSFTPPGKTPEPETADAAKPDAKDESPGKVAEVSWRSVQVHDAPKKNAPTVAKLSRGAKVVVLEQKDEFVRVEIGDGKQGWVVRESVGQ